MFQPKKYQKKDPEYIFDFITRHPFATFVLQGEDLLATHIPILVEGTPENFRLYGHIAHSNEQIRHLKEGIEVLIIFHGVHGYVSSSWYKEKDISTWDYSAVHINAVIKLQTDKELETSLENLVRVFERPQKKPLFYKDIPKKMINDHLPLITGFWCQPTKVRAIAKLHQGYDKEDVHSVISNLENSGNRMSSELSKNIKEEHDRKN